MSGWRWRQRAIRAVAAAGVFVVVGGRAAAADDCSSAFDCTGAPGRNAAAAGVGAALVLGGAAYVAMRRRRPDCDEARMKAKEASERAKAARSEATKARAAAAEAERALAAAGPPLPPPGSDSFITGTGGPLEGQTLTSTDLRHKNLVARKIRERANRHEISRADEQHLLDELDDPRNLDRVRAEGAEIERQMRADRAAKDVEGLTAKRDAARTAAEAAERAAAAAEAEARDLQRKADLACAEAVPASTPPKTAPAFAADLTAIQKQFDDLQRELGSLVECELGTIENFTNAYDDLLRRALELNELYLDTYRQLIPDLEELSALFADMSVRLGRAHVIDTVLLVGAVGKGAHRIGTSAKVRGWIKGLRTAAAGGEAEAGASARTLEQTLEHASKPPPRPVPKATPKPAGEPAPKPAGEPAPKPAGEPAPKPSVEEFDPNAPEPFETGELYEPRKVYTPRQKMVVFGTPGDGALKVISAAKPIEGVWDVVVHGTKDGRFIRKVFQKVYGVTVQTGTEIVDFEEIRQGLLKAGWRPGQPIRLLACESGSSGAGRDLAKFLGTPEVGAPPLPSTPVRAPHQKIAVGPDGNIYHGTSEVVDGEKVFKANADTKWTNFCGSGEQPIATPSGHVPGEVVR